MALSAAAATRCDRLLSLRHQHYQLLTTSARLAETEELLSLGPGYASVYGAALGAFQRARRSYEAAWEAVQRDADGSPSLSMNQCFAGRPCVPGVYDRGCYNCLPGRDGTIPQSCTHSSSTNALMNLVGESHVDNVKSLRSIDCVDASLRTRLQDIRTEMEFVSLLMDELCAPTGVEMNSVYQNIYDQAYSLEKRLQELRGYIKAFNKDIVVNCDITKLQINKLQLISASGIEITVNDENLCPKTVFLTATPQEIDNHICWYISPEISSVPPTKPTTVSEISKSSSSPFSIISEKSTTETSRESVTSSQELSSELTGTKPTTSSVSEGTTTEGTTVSKTTSNETISSQEFSSTQPTTASISEGTTVSSTTSNETTPEHPTTSSISEGTTVSGTTSNETTSEHPTTSSVSEGTTVSGTTSNETTSEHPTTSSVSEGTTVSGTTSNETKPTTTASVSEGTTVSGTTSNETEPTTTVSVSEGTTVSGTSSSETEPTTTASVSEGTTVSGTTSNETTSEQSSESTGTHPTNVSVSEGTTFSKMPSNETTTKEELQSGSSTTSLANVSHFLESTLPPTTFNETISTNKSTSTQEMTTGTELPKVTENEPPFPVFPVNNTTVSETSSTAATSPETTKSSEEWTRPPTTVSPPEVSSTLITSNTTQGVESPTTASLGTTTVSTNCTELSEKEKEALTQLHLNMSSILAKIKDMQTEIEKCMHNATSIQRVLELSSILQNLISKYQEILKSLEAYQNPKDRYRGMNFIRSALKIELRNGTPNPRSQCTDEKTPISLLRSITDLRDLLTKLKNVPEDEDMQNQVICATKRIANVLTTIAKTGDTPTEKDSSKTVKLLKEIEQFALRSVETAATQRESANRAREEELRKQLVVLNSEKKELQDEIDEVEASLRQDEEPR